MLVSSKYSFNLLAFIVVLMTSEAKAILVTDNDQSFFNCIGIKVCSNHITLISTFCLSSCDIILFCYLGRYKKMENCVTPYPETRSQEEVAGGELKPFPERLHAIPPRVDSGSIPGVSIDSFQEDNRLWKKHMSAYRRINKLLDSGRYRNVMDMNAGLGSFAAAFESPKLWVMNVMPTIADRDTLGVIFERGLIGIYHDGLVSQKFACFGLCFKDLNEDP